MVLIFIYNGPKEFHSFLFFVWPNFDINYLLIFVGFDFESSINLIWFNKYTTQTAAWTGNNRAQDKHVYDKRWQYVLWPRKYPVFEQRQSCTPRKQNSCVQNWKDYNLQKYYTPNETSRDIPNQNMTELTLYLNRSHGCILICPLK